ARDVVGVDLSELGLDLAAEPGPVDEGLEGGGRDREAGRHGHARAGHRDERGALAAEQLERRSGIAVEEHDVVVHENQASQVTGTVAGARKERLSPKWMSASSARRSPGARRVTSSSVIFVWSLASMLPRQ